MIWINYSKSLCISEICQRTGIKGESGRNLHLLILSNTFYLFIAEGRTIMWTITE